MRIRHPASPRAADRLPVVEEFGREIPDARYFVLRSGGLRLVYECIRRRLQYSLKHPEFCDIVSPHILWEHKKCMLTRIRYLQDHFDLDPTGSLYEAWKEIEGQARVVRMMVLRFGMRRDRNVLDRAIERLGLVADKERALLERTIRQLETAPALSRAGRHAGMRANTRDLPRST